MTYFDWRIHLLSRGEDDAYLVLWLDGAEWGKRGEEAFVVFGEGCEVEKLSIL
jgi:hypothetical protein